MDFQQADFQVECDSTILVRERSKGSKLEPVFARKTGKEQETAHTIAVLPDAPKHAKVFSKRDIVQASKEQKDKLKKAGKREIIEDSSSSSELETSEKRKGKKTKWGKSLPPEMNTKWGKHRPQRWLSPRERDATLHHRYYLNYRNKRKGAKRGNPAETRGSVKRRKRPR